LYGCEKKGVAGKGICKDMKTKVDKNRRVAKTQRVAEEGRDETGTQSAEPWIKDYRIRYYLSSEKLKTVD
jgi:hypothetical protein